MNNDFKKFAVNHLGVNSLGLHQYAQHISDSYINPTIIEERQLNVAQMDVFSRLMMDRIIFLGAPIDDLVPYARGPAAVFRKLRGDWP